MQQKNLKNNLTQKYYSHQISTINQRKRGTPFQLALSTEQSQIIDLDRLKMNISMLSQSKNYPTLNNQSRLQKVLSSKAAHQAEESIKKEVKGELSGYLLSKYKHYLKRVNTLELQKKFLELTKNPQSSLNKSGTKSINQERKQCKGCSKTPKRLNISQQSRVNNAKEKILRLIELKNTKQMQSTQFKECLQARYLKTEKQKRKNSIIEKAGMKQITKQQWDKQWLKQYNSELMRYRARVLKKSHKYESIRFNDMLQ